jgi:hypothetical protein
MQAVDMAKIFNNKEKQMDLDKRMNLDILKTEWTTLGITGWIRTKVRVMHIFHQMKWDHQGVKQTMNSWCQEMKANQVPILQRKINR